MCDDILSAGGGWTVGAPPSFGHPRLLELLDGVGLPRIDELDFGLIAMDRDGGVVGYNVFEAERAGIARERVLGRNFFVDIGPCTNNYLVAERYRSGDALDEELDYVFTLRMAPTPVRLRLLARVGAERQYLAVRYR